MSKYGDFSGPNFTAFELNAGKYRPEKAPYLDTFHAVICLCIIVCVINVSRTETYLEPSPRSKMELSGNRVNGFHLLTTFAKAQS